MSAPCFSCKHLRNEFNEMMDPFGARHKPPGSRLYKGCTTAGVWVEKRGERAFFAKSNIPIKWCRHYERWEHATMEQTKDNGEHVLWDELQLTEPQFSALIRLVAMLQLVFHEDWDFTRDLIDQDNGCLPSGESFLVPNLDEIPDIQNNHANYGSFILAYRKFEELFPSLKLQKDPPF